MMLALLFSKKYLNSSFSKNVKDSAFLKDSGNVFHKLQLLTVN